MGWPGRLAWGSDGLLLGKIFCLVSLCLVLGARQDGVQAFDYCQQFLRGACQAQCDQLHSPLAVRTYLCNGLPNCCVRSSRIVDPTRVVTTTTPTSTTTAPKPHPVSFVDRAGLLRPKCGRPVHSLVKRVVGGSTAQRCQFPWMVYIKRGHRERDFCSGSLVSDRHVITAAHCMVSLRGYQPVITFGEYDKTDLDSKAKYMTSAFSVLIHPKYNRYSYDNDIAVLTLNQKVPFSSYECLNPLCLPEVNQTFNVGTQCTVAGWGSTSRDLIPKPSSILLHAKVQVVQDERCSQHFRYYYNNQTQICAGDMATAADSCDGDSGGPLMCESGTESRGGDGTLYLAGVISTGSMPCGQEGVPAIYTDVRAARDWLDDVMHDNKD